MHVIPSNCSFLLRLFVRSPGPKKQPLCKPLLPLQTAPHVRSNPATKSRSALCAPGLRGSFIPFSRHPVCQQGLVDDRRHFYFTLLSTTAEQTTLFFSGQYLVVTLHLKLTSTAEKYIQKKGTLILNMGNKERNQAGLPNGSGHVIGILAS